MNNPLYHLKLIEIDEAIKINTDTPILDYQSIPKIEDPVFWISIGAVTCILSGLIYADLMKAKLNKWTKSNESPLPLGNPRTISSWISFFSGLTIIFSSALTIFNYSIIKSLCFSSIVSIVFAITMWKAINNLFVQVYNGTIKEIDQFF